jgi:hypothetical protein
VTVQLWRCFAEEFAWRRLHEAIGFGPLRTEVILNTIATAETGRQSQLCGTRCSDSILNSGRNPEQSYRSCLGVTSRSPARALANRLED